MKQCDPTPPQPAADGDAGLWPMAERCRILTVAMAVLNIFALSRFMYVSEESSRPLLTSLSGAGNAHEAAKAADVDKGGNALLASSTAIVWDKSASIAALASPPPPPPPLVKPVAAGKTPAQQSCGWGYGTNHSFDDEWCQGMPMWFERCSEPRSTTYMPCAESNSAETLDGFFRWLLGRHAVFVGDSLTNLNFCALTCAVLKAHTGCSAATCQNHWRSKKSSIRIAHARVPVESVTLHGIGGIGAKVHFTWLAFQASFFPSVPTAATALLAHAALLEPPPDVLLFGAAHHFHNRCFQCPKNVLWGDGCMDCQDRTCCLTQHVGQNISERGCPGSEEGQLTFGLGPFCHPPKVLEGTMRVFQPVRRRGRDSSKRETTRPILLLPEMAPQHYSDGTTASDGSYDAFRDSFHGNEKAFRAALSNTTCRPVKNLEAAQALHWQNQVIHEHAQRTGIHVVPLYAQLLERWDAHGKDCSHYCFGRGAYLPFVHGFANAWQKARGGT